MGINSHPTKARIISIYGKDPENLDELAECIIAVENANFAGTNRVVGFSWMLSHGIVSNSHSCPLDGVTCWSSREAADGRPRGYPGWNGRLWIRYEKDTSELRLGQNLLGRTCTHTGTGGGGAYGGPWENIYSIKFKEYSKNSQSWTRQQRPHIFSWDYRIYDRDWPGIANYFQEERMVAQLKGTGMTGTYRFLWEDPATKHADNELIKSMKNVESPS